jgi:hypothetical protein
MAYTIKSKKQKTENRLLEIELKEKEKEADKLYNELSKWRGMTWKEAEKKGFGEVEKQKQQRLWHLGYEIVRLKTKLNTG